MKYIPPDEFLLLGESGFIGAYNVFIFAVLWIILHPFVPMLYVFVIFGAVKHYVGYATELYTPFCISRGVEWMKPQIIYIPPTELIIQCVFESIYFLVLFLFFQVEMQQINVLYVYVFSFGFFTHYLAEKIGVHRMFCITYSAK
jgi:hypothetical protein